jgi:hypothetical protein
MDARALIAYVGFYPVIRESGEPPPYAMLKHRHPTSSRLVATLATIFDSHWMISSAAATAGWSGRGPWRS